MNPEAIYGVWVLICDCRLTYKYPAMVPDIDNGEGYIGIGKRLFIWKYLYHQVISIYNCSKNKYLLKNMYNMLPEYSPTSHIFVF